MKAVIYTQYGPPEVLQLKEIEKPIPKDNEVLIQIKATTVTSAEIMMRIGKPYWGRIILGLFKPKKKYRILGIELAGIVVSVGNNITRFNIGDEIFGFTGFKPGANAEFLCLPEKASLALKSQNLSWEEAAASVDGASTALFFLKDKAKLQPGQKVLIIGASGSIGTFAVQLAKHFGAEVTGVCSTKNIDLVKSLGARHVVDYNKVDFTKESDKYDIIFDTVGKSSYLKCKSVIKRTGIYLPTVGLINYILMLWTAIISKLKNNSTKKVIYGMSVEKNQALVFLKDLFEKEKLKPVIDKSYPLEQIVEAHRYVDKGHKRGNVVITMEVDNNKQF